MRRQPPTIIYILADDMGYGDLACNNEESRIPTPRLDALAAGGMRFTDAHAGSSVCTPSRYHVLTGRYAWRSRLKQGIVWEWDLPLLEADRLTVAGLLQQQGYTTHCIGKWHLGWEWQTTDGGLAGDQLPFGKNSRSIQAERVAMNDQIDYTARIGGGPLDRGFDSYFGVDVPNFPPYTWFEDDHLMEPPSVPKPAEMYGHAGLMTPGWTLEGMIPELTRRAVALIEEADAPYFLYLPLTSPHAPIVPNAEFQGRSEAGKYGDFVCEVDWVVSEIVDALRRSGQLDETLLIFTSDNGPEACAADFEGCYELARQTGHYSMAHWRGSKRDVWEGGHRVPFIAHWPETIAAGSVCDQLVCLGDLMATCADLTGAELPAKAGEDSVSMLPLLRGETETPIREYLVHHSSDGRFALRSKEWVYIDNPSGGVSPEPAWFREERGYEAHDQPGELFRLSDDRAERHNLYASEPEVVNRLAGILSIAKMQGEAGPQPPDAQYTE